MNKKDTKEYEYQMRKKKKWMSQMNKKDKKERGYQMEKKRNG